MSDQADEESEHYIIYDYDGDLNREWAAEREREKLNTYRNARQLHPGYAFNKDIDTHLETLDVESKRLQENVQRIGNLISNVNLNLENYSQQSTRKIPVPRMKESSKSMPPKSTKSKPKQLSIQESIDLQQKIMGSN